MKDEINRVTRSQYALQTLDALFASPFLTASDFRERTKLARRTAYDILEELVKQKILVQHRAAVGSRPAILLFKSLLEITEGRHA